MNRFGKKAAVVFAVAFVAFAAVLAGCAEEGSSGKADAAGDYRRVSQTEAAEMMEKETGYLILDVRTEEEFAQGHIPGAVNVPVETIGNEPPMQLPDKDQLVMVYCRSGNRSVTASEKLAALGYTDIVEFGGINTWPGEIVTSSM